MDDSLSHIYEEIEHLDKDKASIKNKVLIDTNYTFKDYTKDLADLEIKTKYLDERLQLLLLVHQTLKNVKKDPKNANLYKNIKDIKAWKIFKENLKDYQWLPFKNDICDICGRCHSSTTSVAVAIAPDDKQLKIICSRCFGEALKTTTS